MKILILKTILGANLRMTSNAMNGVMRDGGFMENSGDFNEIFNDNSVPNNMGINNQQQMPNSSQQKGHFNQQQGNGSTNQFMNNQFNQQMHFGRGDNIGPNRSSSMGMGSDVSGGNFHPQMNNMSQRGPGGNMIPNHMNQMSYMNQQRMNMNQQMNNQTNANQLSQQQMHQMQQHQRMLNHQRMMMMNAAHHNNSHSQLMRPSGPNMSKF